MQKEGVLREHLPLTHIYTNNMHKVMSTEQKDVSYDISVALKKCKHLFSRHITVNNYIKY